METKEVLGLRDLSKAALMATLRKIRVVYGEQRRSVKEAEEEFLLGTKEDSEAISLKSFLSTPRDEEGLEYRVIVNNGHLARFFEPWGGSKVDKRPFHFHWSEDSDFSKMKREQKTRRIWVASILSDEALVKVVEPQESLTTFCSLPLVSLITVKEEVKLLVAHSI